MIDLRFVLAHSLWVLGLAVALASLSYYDWVAHERDVPLGQIFRTASTWRLSLAASVVLVASGFMLMESARWWERGLWLVVWTGAAVDWWKLRRTT